MNNTIKYKNNYKIAIININKPGELSTNKLVKNLLTEKLNISTFSKIEYKNLDKLFANVWNKYNIIICFLATGIVIRKIAPLLKSKTSDPAILVMSFDLKQVVPLLSGHLGGANSFALRLKEIMPSLNVFISTASDQCKTFAFDLFAKEHNFYINNISYLKTISNALINKKTIITISYPAIIEKIKEDSLYKNSTNKELIQFIKLINIEQNHTIKENTLIHTLNTQQKYKEKPKVIISPFQKPTNINNALFIQIKPIYLGIGINKNTDLDTIKKALLTFLKMYKLPIENIEAFASFSAKKDEPGLAKLSKELDKPILFFDKKEINNLKENFSKSKANYYFGIKGVAEPACLLASNYKSCFIKKHSFFRSVTLAIAF